MANENKLDLLFGVGRMVQGDLYNPNTEDFHGKPLVYKTGQDAGKPRTEFFLAVAFPKNGTTHWSQTDWGQKIWAFAHSVWPGGDRSAVMRDDFAFKIDDGDSTKLNKKSKRPCDYEGFPGHWIVKFSGSFQPKLADKFGKRELGPNDLRVKCGDFVQVFATIKSNNNNDNPGLYMNPEVIAHSGYGEEIRGGGVDISAVGFGVGVTLPAGASDVPLAAMNPETAAAQTAPPVNGASAQPPAPAAATAAVSAPPPPTAAATPTPPPNTGFTANAAGAVPPPVAGAAPPPPGAGAAPPPPSGPQYVMTGSLGAYTREQAVASGWTDELLVQHGHMRIA